MPSITNMITTLACIATAASALPANGARQAATTECEKGTWYSSCGETVGCFDHDPCINFAAPTHASEEKPDSTEQKASTTTAAVPTYETIVPDALYDIFPEYPEYAKGKVNGIHLETYDNKSQVEQAIVFKNIPKDAKFCNLQWRQGPRFSTAFVIKGDDSQAEARQLSGFPKEGEDVTYKAVKPFDDAEKPVGGPNFTMWDVSEEGVHGVGIVECAETLAFIAQIRNPKLETQLYLEQDEEKNGWALVYTS
ncbi:hypothetical protein HG530_014978 [Fusarium avenaceum]|nr:hypothetical protein HG530_014978 [Fusarium avenaceum]